MSNLQQPQDISPAVKKGIATIRRERFVEAWIAFLTKYRNNGIINIDPSFKYIDFKVQDKHVFLNDWWGRRLLKRKIDGYDIFGDALHSAKDSPFVCRMGLHSNFTDETVPKKALPYVREVKALMAEIAAEIKSKDNFKDGEDVMNLTVAAFFSELQL